MNASIFLPLHYNMSHSNSEILEYGIRECTGLFLYGFFPITTSGCVRISSEHFVYGVSQHISHMGDKGAKADPHL